MKNASLSFFRCPRPTQGLLFTLALLTGGLAGAQNYVRNPNWAQPLGPDNWTVVYTNGSFAAEFWIAGRTTLAHRDRVWGTWDENTEGTFDAFYPKGPSHFGGHFRPYTGGQPEAYFGQVVTNLTPYASYNVNAWMVQFIDSYTSAVNVWLEAIGTTDVNAPNVYGYAFGNNGWTMSTVTTHATASGQIEVRLHFKKIHYTGGMGKTVSYGWGGYLNIDAFYDHISVIPVVTPPLQPKFSLTLTNQTAQFNWAAYMNNTYDIEMSPDLVNWSKFRTNILASWTNVTYTTNLSAISPGPQFFRVLCYNWVP